MTPIINRWRNGVEAETTERRIVWLEKQITAAEGAINAQKEIIEHDGMTFSYKLSMGSLEVSHNSHVDELSNLMQKRQFEVLNFALTGDRYSNHRAPAETLSIFIGTMQKLFFRIAQGIDTGRFMKKIEPEIKHLCGLEVAAFYPSSFGVQFIAPTNTDLTGQSITALTMERTMALVNTEQPLEEVTLVGPHALVEYRRLIKTLISAGASPKVEWRSPSGEEISWTADYNRLLILSNRLALIKIQKPIVVEANGILVGASLRRKRFEFSSNGHVITGTAPKDMAEKVTTYFNKQCTIVYIEEVYFDSETDQEKTVRTLKDVRHG